MKQRQDLRAKARRRDQAQVGLSEQDDLSPRKRRGVGDEYIDEWRADLSPDEERSLRGHTLAYSRMPLEARQEVDRVLQESLRLSGDDPERLERLAAALAYGNIKGAAFPEVKTLLNTQLDMGGYATGVKEAIRLRFDPLMRAAGSTGEYAGKVGGRLDPLAEYVRDRLLEILDNKSAVKKAPGDADQ